MTRGVLIKTQRGNRGQQAKCSSEQWDVHRSVQFRFWISSTAYTYIFAFYRRRIHFPCFLNDAVSNRVL
jgi:hypothetical protein